jgi:GNAT superfamily N-acetyltransferase
VADESELVIEAVRKDHRRDTFDCGAPELNEYLANYARQNHELGLTKTYVAVKTPDPTVLGYYSLCMGSVLTAHFPPEEVRRFPKYPVPVVHLARLATDRRVRGQGLGALLLVHALRKSYEASRQIASYAVEAIAKDEKARSFYLKYGFKPLIDDPLHLYLSMKTVAKLF